MNKRKRNSRKFIDLRSEPMNKQPLALGSPLHQESPSSIVRRPESKMKIKDTILILNAGANLQKAYFTQDVAYRELPIREIAWRNLDKFSVIVIPAWSDQNLLVKNQRQLTNFIKRGGVLIQFGCHSMRWFSFLAWNIGENDKIIPTEDGLKAGVFDKIDYDYLRWHTEFVCHGYFFTKHERTKILATDENERPILVTVEHGEGVALFTTLDPDFHVINGTFLSKDSDKRIAEAFRLLSSIMKWSVETFNEKHSNWRQIWRRIRGIMSFTTLAWVAYPLLFVTIALSTAYVLIIDDSAQKPANILSTVSGIVGLLITIAQYIRERRSR